MISKVAIFYMQVSMADTATPIFNTSFDEALNSFPSILTFYLDTTAAFNKDTSFTSIK